MSIQYVMFLSPNGEVTQWTATLVSTVDMSNLKGTFEPGRRLMVWFLTHYPIDFGTVCLHYWANNFTYSKNCFEVTRGEHVHVFF